MQLIVEAQVSVERALRAETPDEFDFGELFFGCALEVGEQTGFSDVDSHVDVRVDVGVGWLSVECGDPPLDRLKLSVDPLLDLLLRLAVEGTVDVGLKLGCELGESRAELEVARPRLRCRPLVE